LTGRRCTGNREGSGCGALEFALPLVVPFGSVLPHIIGRILDFRRCAASATEPVAYHLGRGVAAADPKRQPKRECDSTDGRHEQRVHKLTGNADLVNCNDDWRMKYFTRDEQLSRGGRRGPLIVY